MGELETKASIQKWMNDVLVEKAWTPNEWATRAGTSPTNITRFISKMKAVPNVATIAKLAEVAGSQPSLAEGAAIKKIDTRIVPLYHWDSLMNKKPEIKGQIVVPTASTKETFAVISQTDSMDLAGINIGDVVVFDKSNENLKPGSIVLCICDSKNGKKITRIGEWQPKQIIFKSTRPIPPSSSCRDRVIGVARYVIREIGT